MRNVCRTAMVALVACLPVAAAAEGLNLTGSTKSRSAIFKSQGALIDKKLPTQTYQVFLNDKGKLRWKGYDDGVEVILSKEPQSTWGQRAKANFMRILPIRGQL